MASKINRVKLVFRGVLFFSCLFLYLFKHEQLIQVIEWNIGFGITPPHILWVVLMLELIIVPIPSLNYYVSRGKQFKAYYSPTTNSADYEGLISHTQTMNRRATATMILWLLLIGIISLLYVRRIIGKIEMYLIMLFFYLGDQICINIWCPFQFFIMKEKCCNACRIYNWGHFMMFSHFVFIPNFFTLSLFGMGLLILIQWEYLHHKYPYRFYEGTNLALRCSHCQDRGCRIKKRADIIIERSLVKLPMPSVIKKIFIQNYHNINSHV